MSCYWIYINAKNIYPIWENIEKKLSHHLAGKFYKICEKYDTPYLILGDIISENPIETPQKIKNPEILENKIKYYYQKRLNTLDGRIKRAAIYVTLSIFITKMLLAFAIEVPFDKYLTNQYNSFTLLLSVLIPPILMFFLVLTIKPPQKENLQRVITETIKITYQREKKDVYQIKPSPKRGWIMNFIIIMSKITIMYYYWKVGFLYYHYFIIIAFIINLIIHKQKLIFLIIFLISLIHEAKFAFIFKFL